MADSVAYRREATMDEDVFLSCDVAMLTISVVPVCYSLGGKEYKETYWVATVLPQPGVDLLRCIERLGKPIMVTNVFE
eukprot:3596540-Rhodomonas_salina.2